MYSIFKYNVWAADLPEVGLVSFKNRRVTYFLCAKDVFTKYAWVKPLIDEKTKTVLNRNREWIHININEINYGLIEEQNFIITLSKNGIMIFKVFES